MNATTLQSHPGAAGHDGVDPSPDCVTDETRWRAALVSGEGEQVTGGPPTEQNRHRGESLLPKGAFGGEHRQRPGVSPGDALASRPGNSWAG